MDSLDSDARSVAGHPTPDTAGLGNASHPRDEFRCSIQVKSRAYGAAVAPAHDAPARSPKSGWPDVRRQTSAGHAYIRFTPETGVRVPAAVEKVRSLLASACDNSAAEAFEVDDRQLVIANIGRSDEVSAVRQSLAALAGTGWTAYAAAWFDGPQDPIDRIIDRRTFEKFRGLPPPRRCEPPDWSIPTVLAAADCLTDQDIDNQLADLERDRSNFWRHHMDVEISLQLTSTEQRYGTAPDIGDIPPAARGTPASLDRWLLGWERQHGAPQVGTEFPQWLLGMGAGASIVALPWARPEAVLAADLFLGAPAVLAVALLKRWNRRYGTRVVSHCGSGVALQSERLPATVDEAYPIARAIDLIANDLLGGGSPYQARRAYAYGLMSSERWWMWASL